MNQDELLAMLNLPGHTDFRASFEDLGVDSWNLVELRATLETRHGIRLSDEDWLSLETPNEVLELCR
jgi:acyl carrier protein